MRRGENWSLGKLTRQRPDGSSYWSFCIKWVDGSGPHRVSLGTTDRSAAEASASDFWTRRTLVEVGTVGEVVDAYLPTLEGTAGKKRKDEAWVAAKPFWGPKRVTNLVADIENIKGSGRSYMEWRDKAANTIRKETGLVIEALGWAVDKGLLPRAPHLYIPPIPESEVQHLTKREFRKFLTGCKAPHVTLFAQLALATAARSNALLELPWARVDFDRKQINLKRAPRSEDGEVTIKPRAHVPITDQLYPLLVNAKEAAQTMFVIETGGQRILSIRKGFEAASERSGVYCTPHMLRHSAAVWMAEARTPMEEIAAYLGHKNTRVTTSTYARFHPDYLRRAAKALVW